MKIEYIPNCNTKLSTPIIDHSLYGQTTYNKPAAHAMITNNMNTTLRTYENNENIQYKPQNLYTFEEVCDSFIWCLTYCLKETNLFQNFKQPFENVLIECITENERKIHIPINEQYKCAIASKATNIKSGIAKKSKRERKRHKKC